MTSVATAGPIRLHASTSLPAKASASIAEFSVAYADQNQRDYEALKVAIQQGTVKAEAGI